MATRFGFSRLFTYAASSCFKNISPLPILRQSAPAIRLSHDAAPKTRVPWLQPDRQYEIKDLEYNKELDKEVPGVINEINRQIATKTTGRLFAVIHLCGKQFKVTEHDIIIVQGVWPPQPGDALKLEKVMVVGSKDFTLIGRPILDRELVNIDATVIDKTLSHTKIRFRMRKRKQFKRINFCRVQHTMLRINAITINDEINKRKEVEGLDRIY